MALKFKVGDVVRLKSGGPPMTIVELPEEEGFSYFCQWFDGSDQKGGNFQGEALELYQRPPVGGVGGRG